MGNIFGHYRLIRVKGKLYRYLPGIELPEGAELVLESIADYPQYWALLRYRPKVHSRG